MVQPYGTGSNYATWLDDGGGAQGGGSAAPAGGGMSADAKTAKSYQTAGVGLMAVGAAQQAVAAYYAARAQKRQLRFQANELKFQQYMTSVNARRAEMEAMDRLRAGQVQAMQQTLQAGQVKAAQTVGLAASGVEAGSGTIQDILNSTDFMKEVDKATIDSNTARAVGAARMQAGDLRAQGAILGGQAGMLMAARRAVSPWPAISTMLVGQAAQGAMMYSQYKREERYYSSMQGGLGTPGANASAPAADPRMDP